MNTEQIEKTGHRITKARKQILVLFDGDHVTLSIKDILKKVGKNADRATVYRNLKFLEQIDLLTSFTSDEETYYELAEHGHHHHLICKNCGNTYEISISELEKTVKGANKFASQNYDFKVTEHKIDFYGYCKNCQSI